MKGLPARLEIIVQGCGPNLLEAPILSTETKRTDSSSIPLNATDLSELQGSSTTLAGGGSSANETVLNIVLP